MRKINIHLTVDESALTYCREVNAGIRKITNSIIVFDDESPMIPHISVIMGKIDDNQTLSEIADVAGNLLSDWRPLIISVGPPYLENVRNRYVFSDLDGGQAFKKLKQEFHRALKARYLHVQTDYTDQAHLTLGHVEDKRDEVRRYLSQVQADFEFVSKELEISDAGPKGTCINSLFKYEITGK